MKKIRCAIYTRKSSEEGLEQDFNSLHAQREACSAYILSQASEGWSLLDEDYDDGGLSGGTLERPALQRLLNDIDAGKIDIVVVYKVDRLTRSLLDFSKLVEAFDKAGTSFVSVTQSFNTTTSMGRLTLNMLLSFAQFEREVTAERIRDKIAASKAKGMWMGGTPPLGYRPDGRTLAIVNEHATLIRELFTRYLELGNVPILLAELQKSNVRVPVRHTSTGRAFGGGTFTRGQLYHILSNPIYVGEIHHGGNIHQGKHEAIVSRGLWTQVQAGLANNSQGKQRAASIKSPSVLAGLVFDAEGRPLVASHACKGKVRYRYYVSSALQRGEGTSGLRIPAKELEDAVRVRVAETLDQPLALLAKLHSAPDAHRLQIAMDGASKLSSEIRGKENATLRSLVSRVEVDAHELRIHLSSDCLLTELGVVTETESAADLTITSPVKLSRSGQALRLVQPDGTKVITRGPEQPLIDLLLKARRWWARLNQGDIDVATLAREEDVNDS